LTDQSEVQDQSSDSSAAEIEHAEFRGFQKWLVENKDLVIRLGILAFVIGFALIGSILWRTGNLNTQNVGYGGVWIVSFIAAGSIILPVPGPAAVCVAAAPALGLNPLLIGVISATAEALGEMTGYMAGLSGRSLLERHKYYPKVRAALVKRGGLILFFGSVVPNPLFDIIGIAAGSIGYPIKKFLGAVVVAKAIKSTAIAYACFWGIDSIQSWVG